jgi:hypothetical protein
MAGDSISAAFDFDTDDGLEEMRRQAGLQGTRALDLAANLRKGLRATILEFSATSMGLRSVDSRRAGKAEGASPGA